MWRGRLGPRTRARPEPSTGSGGLPLFTEQQAATAQAASARVADLAARSANMTALDRSTAPRGPSLPSQRGPVRLVAQPTHRLSPSTPGL